MSTDAADGQQASNAPSLRFGEQPFQFPDFVAGPMIAAVTGLVLDPDVEARELGDAVDQAYRGRARPEPAKTEVKTGEPLFEVRRFARSGQIWPGQAPPSISVLIRPRVVCISRWSSAPKESTPPKASLVRLTEMSEMPCGASRR